jgi:hypothetical protein
MEDLHALTWADRALLMIEELRLRMSRARGLATFRPWETYFDQESGFPRERRYFEQLERINEEFPAWLDPGEVGPPDPSRIELGGGLVRFPSACPSGDPAVDSVALRVYPAPSDATDVGILFHHWFYLDSWAPIDYLLKPLTRRFRVAVMVAPHHMMRRAPGFGPGEGMFNPNVLSIYQGLRQWQADHAACLALLEKNFGFRRTVLLGYSLGGLGSLLSRMFRASLPTVTVCVTNCLPRGVFEGIATRHLVPRLWEAGFSYDSFCWASRSLHLARWAPRIGGRDLTWMYARHDAIEPRESLCEPVSVLNPERVVELPGGHATAALFRERIATEVIDRAESVATSRAEAAPGDAIPA